MTNMFSQVNPDKYITMGNYTPADNITATGFIANIFYRYDDPYVEFWGEREGLWGFTTQVNYKNLSEDNVIV